MGEKKPKTGQQAGDEPPSIYSVSLDKEGSLHFSRKDFLSLGLAVGGALLAKGLCPRFGGLDASSNPPAQAGMAVLPKAYVHAQPKIDSNILEVLQQNDFVQLIGDHPDLGWMEIVTRTGQQGWLKRGFVDFGRLMSQAPLGFNASGAHVADQNTIYLPIVVKEAPTATPTEPPTTTPCPSHQTCPSNVPCPANQPCLSNVLCPNNIPCPTNFLCPANFSCPPVESCVPYVPCACHALPNPCTCNSAPCGCVANFCSCNTLPCICNTAPCGCVTYTPCTCVGYIPCGCVANICPIT